MNDTNTYPLRVSSSLRFGVSTWRRFLNTSNASSTSFLDFYSPNIAFVLDSIRIG
ncbi:MAG: hypothetical protein ACYCR7_03645 [Thermoplasmataceae archaeon]